MPQVCSQSVLSATGSLDCMTGLKGLALMQDEAADLIANQPPDLDKTSRIDLTHHTIVTIDDASTTEIDDGLSAEMLPDGRLRLWVHVADPSRWLQPGDPLDMEARRRATSLYLPTGAGCLAKGFKDNPSTSLCTSFHSKLACSTAT